MLLFLAIFYTFQHFINTNATPLLVNWSRQTNIGATNPQACICQDQRSVWDIIWSCLVTIFACSWVSVHPNIPGPNDTWLQKALRRLELMFWSIISPELIITWAMRQWLGARQLQERYREYGWTRTHGYFIQMGGFMLHDRENIVRVIGPPQLEELLAEGKVKMPTVTENDIQDRSKGDGLSKALVVVQTTWFIAQCIARRSQGLVTTQLELATLAFATLNGIMYFLWWNKPLNVESTVPVYLLHARPSLTAVEAASSMTDKQG